MHYVSCDPYEVEAAVEVLSACPQYFGPIAEEIRAAMREHRAAVRLALSSDLADLLGY
jgi:hypothetical protein